MATDIFKDLEFDGKAIKHARLVNCVLPSGKSVEEVEKAAESVGDLDDLDTTNKSSLVSAINELKALVDTLSQTVETLSEKVEGVTIDLSEFTLTNNPTDVTSAIPVGYTPSLFDKVLIDGGDTMLFMNGGTNYRNDYVLLFGFESSPSLFNETTRLKLEHTTDKWFATLVES